MTISLLSQQLESRCHSWCDPKQSGTDSNLTRARFHLDADHPQSQCAQSGLAKPRLIASFDRGHCVFGLNS